MVEGTERLTDAFRARGKRNVVLCILKDRHTNQPGVIVTSIYSTKDVHREPIMSILHQVLIGYGSIIQVSQPCVRQLDPKFILPFRIPVYKQL